VPLFETIIGVDYLILLQADVAFEEKVLKDEEDVVKALTTGLDFVLNKHFGDKLKTFSIWKDTLTFVKHQYFVVITISGSVDQMQYFSILQLTNDIIQRKHSLSNVIHVSFCFNSTVGFAFYSQGWRLDGILPHLVKSFNGNRSNVNENLKTPLFISPQLLCYRISLSKNEMIESLNEMMRDRHNKRVHRRNLQRVSGKKLYITCIHDVLQNFKSSMNVLSRNDASNYKFVQKTLLDEKGDTSVNIGRKNDNGMINKSTIATFATSASIVFVLMIRNILKRRFKGQIDTNVVEFVNVRNSQNLHPDGQDVAN
jgi:hypothetical protein